MKLFRFTVECSIAPWTQEITCKAVRVLEELASDRVPIYFVFILW